MPITPHAMTACGYLRGASGVRNLASSLFGVGRQTVVEWSTRLQSRQQLQNRRQYRSFSLLCGDGAQDVCAIIIVRSPWPTYSSWSLLPSSIGRRGSARIAYSSRSSVFSVWKRSSSSADASVKSGKAQTIEQLWEEYFADPFQWWDNRVDKMNPKLPDFSHKVIRRALWLDCWSTPAWSKAKIRSVTEGRLQSHASYGTRDFQTSAQGNKARELRRIGRSGGGNTGMQSDSTVSGAIAVIENRLQQGMFIDPYMYAEVLKRCLKPEGLTAVKKIHDCIIKGGMEQSTYLANNLLSAYIRCGRLPDARQVFDGLVKKNVYSWTIMIGGYAQHNHAKDAVEIFNQMRQGGEQPNEVTYLSILKAFASPSALKWGKEVHGYIRHDGLESDVRVGTAVLQMYAKCGCIKEARQIFEKLNNRNILSWNVMIGAYAGSGLGAEAYRLFLQLTRHGVKPNAITYMSILNECASVGALEWVREVYIHALKAGLESDLRVGSAFVHMYAKSGSIYDARRVFDRMVERNVITWNVMIRAYAESGRGAEAYRLFLQMKREGFKPDAFTYVSLLNAHANEGALEWVKEVYIHALKAGLESDLRVSSAFVHMYAKSGSIYDARRVFDRMVERDVITWNVMIGAYAESGRGAEAYRLFLQMKREGFKPDAFTYVNLLNAHANEGALEWVKEVHNHVVEAGLESDLRVSSALVHMYARSGSIDDARRVFDGMEERHVITWNIMIGGLAQHGRGHEALAVFRRMVGSGLKPNESSFVAILSACSHAGLLDDGRELFLAMTQDFGIKPTVVHYNCIVDLLGRAGCLEEAKIFIGSMPVEPDGTTWGALLGACRTYGNVELGELAAKEVLKLDPKDASAYVLLSNIYAGAGKWDQVSLVRTMMRENGIRKEPGCSWIEVGNKIHRFIVGDTSHPEAKDIYAELNRLTEMMKTEGYIPDTRLVLKNIDEEEKELALCSHSEKLAIAYGLMHTPYGEPIRIYKNLRVCSDCHTATKFISKVTGREIVARDASRFHHFKDGRCSCGDYW